MMNKPLVTVITPIYKVEKFIDQCARSLLRQQYEHMEYIFIDDNTPDRSMEILQQEIRMHPDRKGQVQIIKHSTNKGLPAGRNSGLAIATGEYIFHCDSDDWVEPEMVHEMVACAEASQADIVYTDWFLSFTTNERYMKQPALTSPDSALAAMLDGRMKYNVWNKLIKRNLYTENGILFPEGRSMGEDMTIMKLFCHAKTVVHLPRAYYHYMQTNPNAFTKQYSQQKLDDMRYNTRDLEDYIGKFWCDPSRVKLLHYFKLNVKLPFLIGVDETMYDTWRSFFVESNGYIKQCPGFSFRTRLIQYAALYKMDWFIRWYNISVMRFIYGFLYK